MTKPRDAKLTPELAAQVCARNDGGAAISGVIASLEGRYVITLIATDCVTGHVLSRAKAEASRKADVPDALDKAIGHIRADLGETFGSITKFSVPILQKRTNSFEALKDYSQGAWLFNHGSRPEGRALFEHAVELDPDFATAWTGVAVARANLHDVVGAEVAATKAYRLRGTVSERESLHIANLYHDVATHDLEAAVQTAVMRTTIYPDDSAAWATLSNVRNTLGRYDDAIQPGRRAVALGPFVESDHSVLVRALTNAGHLDEARTAGERAVAAGVAGDDIRAQLFDLAYIRDDSAEAARQLAWSSGKPAEVTMLVHASLMAFSDGRVRDGLAFSDQANVISHRQGGSDELAAGRARLLAELGFTALALSTIKVLPGDADSQDLMYVLAMIGDAERAQTILDGRLARTPRDTLLVGDFAPAVRAALLLRQGQPVAAVAALRPANAYRMIEFDVPYQMGYTLLAAGDPVGAETEFRDILAHPGRWLTGPQYPLARLGLAQALKAAGDVAGAKREYADFIDRWKTADTDVPILVQAKNEMSRMR